MTVAGLVDLYEEQRGICALTRLPLVLTTGDLCSISIDRKDSNRGHVMGNVQLVCVWANRAKIDQPDDAFLEVMRRIRMQILEAD